MYVKRRKRKGFWIKILIIPDAMVSVYFNITGSFKERDKLMYIIGNVTFTSCSLKQITLCLFFWSNN